MLTNNVTIGFIRLRRLTTGFLALSGSFQINFSHGRLASITIILDHLFNL